MEQKSLSSTAKWILFRENQMIDKEIFSPPYSSSLIMLDFSFVVVCSSYQSPSFENYFRVSYREDQEWGSVLANVFTSKKFLKF